MVPQREEVSVSPPTQPEGAAASSSAIAVTTSVQHAQLEDALLREHERLERIFDTVPLMMTIYEPDTNVLRVNRAFERLVGWSSDDLASVSLMEQCYPDPQYRQKAQEYMQACLPEWRDFRVRTRDGREIESSWTNVRLSDNSQLGIGIDITERNRADEKLRRSEADLRQSEEALRRANRLKDEFLAMLAHELRNPLSAMRNVAEILRHAGTSPATADKAVAILERQLGLMVRLVDDLLDLSRISTGKIDLHRSRVDLNAIVRRAVESIQPLFQSKQHQLVYEPSSGPPVIVDGDPTRLEQVFANLLHNAAKFTPAGGVVTIDITCQSGEACVRVRDSGIGISSEILPRIFEMFVQADRSIDQGRGGLGIGLNLVERLVQLHGGSVAAFSAGVGHGSEFVVRLPLLMRVPEEQTAAPEAAALSESGDESADRQRRAILVVDDNVDAAETLAQMLTVWGHDVVIAQDGRSGIDLGKTRAFDVIVMDLGMPGMSGYSAARLIRADPHFDGVLLVALTGWSQGEARRQSAQAGFDHHLVKPVELGLLREILARPLPRRHPPAK